jgi:hypothetical protein
MENISPESSSSHRFEANLNCDEFGHIAGCDILLMTSCFPWKPEGRTFLQTEQDETPVNGFLGRDSK